MFTSNSKGIKKFIFKVILYFTIIIVPCVLAAFIIDPYNVFHADNIRKNGVDPNRNYIKTRYIIKNPNKFDSLLFGSSRVGFIHVDKIENEKCYNMTMSAATPVEHYYNIVEILKTDTSIKKIYIGIDSRSYTTDYTDHDSQPLYASYTLSKEKPFDFWKLYINPLVNFNSLKSFLSDHNSYYENSKESYIFYEYGWDGDYGYKSSYNFNEAEPEMGSRYYYDDCIEALKNIKTVCDKNNIELVLFTNPMYCVTYEASLEKNYYNFLRDVAEISPYYNFSGYNKITTDPLLYIDPSHFSAEASDYILNCIWGNRVDDNLRSEGFGFYVTNNNVEELIRILTENRERYLKQ